MNTVARVIYKEDMANHNENRSMTTRGMSVEEARKKYKRYAKRVLKEFDLDFLTRFPEGELVITGDTVCACVDKELKNKNRVMLAYEEYEVPEVLKGCHSYYKVVLWTKTKDIEYEYYWRPDIVDTEESQLFVTKEEAEEYMNEWIETIRQNDAVSSEPRYYSWNVKKKSATAKRYDGEDVEIFIEKVIL